MPDAKSTAEPMHVQITGDLPWCVLGWHSTYDDVPDELTAVYSPVSSREAADQLAEALAHAAPGSSVAAKFTIMPIFPVRSDPGAPAC